MCVNGVALRPDEGNKERHTLPVVEATEGVRRERTVPRPVHDHARREAVERSIAPAPIPEPAQADEPAEAVNRTLEELAKEGARRMLERALAVEVDEFLGRQRHERRLLAEQGYRNGYGRPRPVAVGTWPIEVKAPRIRDLPAEMPRPD